mgnify:CR=1 FL=1
MPKTKELNGRELAGFIKTRQANMVSSFSPHRPRLVILRDNDNPVIQKYVNLKIRYGADIGVEVVDQLIADPAALKATILKYNQDPNTHGLILQLPLISTDPDELTTDASYTYRGTDEFLLLDPDTKATIHLGTSPRYHRK